VNVHLVLSWVPSHRGWTWCGRFSSRDIQQVGATDWRAAAFLLERHHAERWSLNADPDELELLLEEELW